MLFSHKHSWNITNPDVQVFWQPHSVCQGKTRPGKVPENQGNKSNQTCDAYPVLFNLFQNSRQDSADRFQVADEFLHVCQPVDGACQLVLEAFRLPGGVCELGPAVGRHRVDVVPACADASQVLPEPLGAGLWDFHEDRLAVDKKELDFGTKSLDDFLKFLWKNKSVLFRTPAFWFHTQRLVKQVSLAILLQEIWLLVNEMLLFQIPK